MENVFEKFNEMFDLAGLQNDIASASANSNTGEFEPVPHDDYEVKIVSRFDKKLDKQVDGIHLGETGEQSKTPGMPMAQVTFEIITGEYKGRKIFMNQMLTSGFGIHKMNEFLESLQSGVTIQFENFVQYADLFAQVFNAIDGKAEYQLSYKANPKNEKFSTYDIVQRY